MAPKAKRAASPGPKAKGKAKAEAKAAKAPEPDPKAEMMKEAEELWEKHENEGIMKLKDFAAIIDAMNIKKCQLFGEHPGPTTKEQWSNSGGATKRELNKEQFLAWYPTWIEYVEAKVKEREGAEAKKEEEKVAKAAEKATRFQGDDIWRIRLDEMQDALNAAFEKGKTPLIIDNTEGQRSEAFFSYSGAYILEAKKMVMDKAKGASAEDVCNEERERFWRGNCFKYGQTVVFRMSNCAADFRKTFNTETFPAMKLLDTPEWKRVLGLENADNFKGCPFEKMCRNDEDKGEMMMGVNEKFRVVVITHFKDEDYAGFLENQFPLELCQAIHIAAEK